MQKDEEEFYLGRARETYSEFPPSDPVRSESPDFLFPTPAGILGVEVTDFVRGLSSSSVTMRTLDYLRMRVAVDGKTKFEAKHQIPLWVGLHWNDRYKFKKRDVDRIGSQLVSLIETHIPLAPYESVSFDIDDSDIEAPIFDALPRISTTRLKDGSRGSWAAMEVGFIGATAADIQAVVNQKEPKVSSYLSRCTEVWLLIVASGVHISSTVDFKRETGATISTRFDRVLLYDGVGHSVTRLK